MKEFDSQKVLVDDPLYTKYDLSDAEDKEVFRLFNHGSLDAYCPACETKSVFKINGVEWYQLEEKAKSVEKFGVLTARAKCVRQNMDSLILACDHDFYSVFYRSSDEMVKIGQYPSKADLDFGDLDESFRELSDPHRRELGSAIGLFSHGVGIGSFVYLRRIFEGLVYDACAEAEKDESVDPESFKKARMQEKLNLLKGYLPARLVKSSHLYGVLSKGIHELSEEECRAAFPLVRQAIQLILKEKHENKEYERLISSLHHS